MELPNNQNCINNKIKCFKQFEGFKISFTQYNSKYFAHLLTLQNSANSIDRLSQSIFNAQIDLNPHQVEVALFTFKSPLSSDVILADEVGLGKTIEAGLVITQYWSERRRKILRSDVFSRFSIGSD